MRSPTGQQTGTGARQSHNSAKQDSHPSRFGVQGTSPTPRKGGSLFGVSWNVRGLGDPSRKLSLKKFIDELGEIPHFIAIQEGNVNDFWLQQMVRFIGNGFQLVGPGANHAERYSFLLVGAGITIINQGSVLAGRGTWAEIQHNGDKLLVASIYAPNVDTERATFWKALQDDLPEVPGIIAGDFNMTENANDRMGHEKTMWGTELLSWNGLKLHQDLIDVLLSKDAPGTLNMTWDNGRSGSACNKARLDRFYATQGGWWFTRSSKIKLHRDQALSDHLPISCKWEWGDQVVPGRESYFKLNCLLLRDTRVQEQFETLWKSLPRIGTAKDFWEMASKRTVDFFREIGKEKAKSKREHRNHLSRELEQLRLLEIQHGFSTEYRSRGALAAATIRRMDAEEANNSRIQARIKWAKEGDIPSRYFFKQLKAKHQRENINAVQDSNGRILSRAEEITQTFERHFQETFQHRNLNHEARTHQERFARASTRLEEVESVALDAFPTAPELRRAMLAMGLDKAPGEDGLPAEFYQTFWHILERDFLELAKEIWRDGTMFGSMSRSVIKLIPKKPDRLKIGDWRPISLLTVAYKIIAKTMSFRLQPLMRKLVHEEQAGFIKGRYIMDNVLAVWAGLEYAQHSGQDILFIKLDFEKAYDRLDLNFLEATLEGMQFGPMFRRMVAGLMGGGSGRALINGNFTQEFAIQKGVRQGCPLAPLLFAISTQPLIERMKELANSQMVKGLGLPTGERLISRLFADDTGIFSSHDPNELEAFSNCLTDFCQASGAKLNEEKTEVLFTGDEANLQHVRDKGWKIIQPGQSIKYLGIQVGVDIGAKEQVAGLMDKMRTKISELQIRWLSFPGRALAVKHLLLPMATYLSSCLLFDATSFKSITQMARDLLWSRKEGGKKICLTDWKSCTRPKSQGGLGILDIKTHAICLLGKWWIRLLLGEKGHWATLLKYNINNARQGLRRGWPTLDWRTKLLSRVKLSQFPLPLGERLWRAWEQIRNHLVINLNPETRLWRKTSVWWNLSGPGDNKMWGDSGDNGPWAMQRKGLGTIEEFWCQEAWLAPEAAVLKIPTQVKKSKELLHQVATVLSTLGKPTKSFQKSLNWIKFERGHAIPKYSAHKAYQAIHHSPNWDTKLNKVWDLEKPTKWWSKTFKLLWTDPLSGKTKHLIWRIYHGAVYTKVWQWRIGKSEGDCDRCSGTMDTTQHAFWDCPATQRGWRCLQSLWERTFGDKPQLTLKCMVLGRESGLSKNKARAWRVLRACAIEAIWQTHAAFAYGKGHSTTDIISILESACTQALICDPLKNQGANACAELLQQVLGTANAEMPSRRHMLNIRGKVLKKAKARRIHQQANMCRKKRTEPPAEGNQQPGATRQEQLTNIAREPTAESGQPGTSREQRAGTNDPTTAGSHQQEATNREQGGTTSHDSHPDNRQLGAKRRSQRHSSRMPPNDRNQLGTTNGAQQAEDSRESPAGRLQTRAEDRRHHSGNTRRQQQGHSNRERPAGSDQGESNCKNQSPRVHQASVSNRDSPKNSEVIGELNPKRQLGTCHPATSFPP